MFRRFLPCAVLLALVALPTVARPAENKKAVTPGVIVRVQSLDDLVSNFRYLAGLVGREEEAKQLEGMLRSKAGGPKGLEGIDAKRPMALYGVFSEGGIENSTAVALVPIADEKAFLGLIENLGYKAEKDKDGVYLVSGDNLKAPVYFRFAHKHAYLTAMNKDAIDKDKILAPGAVLPAEKGPVLSITVRIDQIPEKVRKLAIDQVETQLSRAKEEMKEDETPAQHAAKGELLDLIKKYTVSVIEDGGAVALRLDVDRTAKELSAELALSGKDGTPLAKNISALGKAKSVVAGLVAPDSVMNLLVDLPNEEKFAEAMQALLKDEISKGIAKESDPEKKAQAEKIFKAFAPAIKFTDADWAIDFRGPRQGGLYTIVGGLKVADGTTLDKAIRNVVKELPEKERSQIKLDADKSGEVAIHRIETNSADENFKKSFGDGPAYFAVRSDAAFLTFGDGALEALKEALKVQPKVGKPLQFEVSVARIADAMAQEKPEAPKAAEKAFGKDKGADKIRLSLEAGGELKVRFVMKTAVLTFFHLMEPGAEK
jgi:hypothetical protein